MRLIDADELRTSIERDRDASDMPKMWHEGIAYAINHIIHAPTVELVRCKDCKHHEDEVPGMVWCPHIIGNWVNDDWFCADGERKGEENE